MYIESIPNRSSPPAILLRESFREGGRVGKRTLANLSAWPTELVEGLRTLLKCGVAVAADGIHIRRALPPLARRQEGQIANRLWSVVCIRWLPGGGRGI